MDEESYTIKVDGFINVVIDSLDKILAGLLQYKAIFQEQDAALSECQSNLSSVLDTMKMHLNNDNHDYFIQSIDSFSKQYSQTVDNNSVLLEKAISTLPEGSYFLEITSGVAIAFMIFLANYLYISFINNKNNRSHYSSTVLSLLNSFESLALDYWMKNKTNKNETEMVLSEFKIKSEFNSIQETAKLVAKLIDDDESKQKLENLISDLYDSSTGGDFERKVRNMNKATSQKINRLCSQIKVILIRYDNQKLA